MTRLTVIDQETREELAEFGIEPERRVVLCADCEYQRLAWTCVVNGGGYGTIHNPHGECERFKQRESFWRRHVTVENAMVASVAFILGAVLL